MARHDSQWHVVSVRACWWALPAASINRSTYPC
jgi:hypothetical protein